MPRNSPASLRRGNKYLQPAGHTLDWRGRSRAYIERAGGHLFALVNRLPQEEGDQLAYQWLQQVSRSLPVELLTKQHTYATPIPSQKPPASRSGTCTSHKPRLAFVEYVSSGEKSDIPLTNADGAIPRGRGAPPSAGRCGCGRDAPQRRHLTVGGRSDDLEGICRMDRAPLNPRHVRGRTCRRDFCRGQFRLSLAVT